MVNECTNWRKCYGRPYSQRNWAVLSVRIPRGPTERADWFVEFRISLIDGKRVYQLTETRWQVQFRRKLVSALVWKRLTSDATGWCCKWWKPKFPTATSTSLTVTVIVTSLSRSKHFKTHHLGSINVVTKTTTGYKASFWLASQGFRFRFGLRLG